jgi:hypothetical protein
MIRQTVLALALTGPLRFAGLMLNASGAGLGFDCQFDLVELRLIYRQSTGISYSVVLAA